MKNLPSDNKGQLDLPKQLLHWGVLGQRTSVEFQPLVRTEEQPCQVFPRQGKIIQLSCVKMITVESILNKKPWRRRNCFQNKGLTLIHSYILHLIFRSTEHIQLPVNVFPSYVYFFLF